MQPFGGGGRFLPGHHFPSLLMRALLLGLCVGLSLGSCQKQDPTPVSIRVRNASPYPLENVVVNTSGGKNTYGTVGVGQASAYQPFAYAYPYAFVQSTVQGQELYYQIIDYTGEDRLEPGQYTYVLDVSPGIPQHLTLQLEKP